LAPGVKFDCVGPYNTPYIISLSPPHSATNTMSLVDTYRLRAADLFEELDKAGGDARYFRNSQGLDGIYMIESMFACVLMDPEVIPFAVQVYGLTEPDAGYMPRHYWLAQHATHKSVIEKLRSPEPSSVEDRASRHILAALLEAMKGTSWELDFYLPTVQSNPDWAPFRDVAVLAQLLCTF